MRPRSARQAGFSLIEVVVALAVLSIVSALSLQALLSTQKTATESMTRFSCEHTIESALAIMIPELRKGGSSGAGTKATVVDTSPDGGAAQRITIYRAESYDATLKKINFSTDAVKYWYVTSEGRIKRQEGTGTVTVIARGVDSTFSFALANDEVTINISCTKSLPSDKNRNVTVSAVEKIALRN